MWPVIEPSTEFVDGWHLGAICEHEQAVFEGQIKKLIINICPRSGKSICTSVNGVICHGIPDDGRASDVGMGSRARNALALLLLQ